MLTTGYVCDPRPDAIGILVTACASDAVSNAGPVLVGQVVHVEHDERTARLEALIDGDLTTEVSIRFCCTFGKPNVPFWGFDVAMRLERQITMADALARVVALLEAKAAAEAQQTAAIAETVPAAPIIDALLAPAAPAPAATPAT